MDTPTSPRFLPMTGHPHAGAGTVVHETETVLVRGTPITIDRYSDAHAFFVRMTGDMGQPMRFPKNEPGAEAQSKSVFTSYLSILRNAS